jgi:anionic cell wall polymer biosynthesis LytR-Cps2A-Psr (LCP) family protein
VRPDHLAMVNFAAFVDLIDSVGGVSVYVPRTMRDAKSHLPELAAGCQRLDGRTALAYVRSRYTQTKSNGQWRADATGTDFGRIERQQQVIAALMRSLLGPELPMRVPALLNVAGSGLVLDDKMSPRTAARLAASLARAANGGVSGFTVPGRGATIAKQSVVLTATDELADTLRLWRAAVGDISTDSATTATPTATPKPDPKPTSAAPRGGPAKDGVGTKAQSCP